MSTTKPSRPTERLKRWFVGGQSGESEGPYEAVGPAHTHPWWQVMCLTGVDYFSTLGYQPGIAALAAGVLSPLATLVLVGLTLLGALPVYRRVAGGGPPRGGSVAVLAAHLPRRAGEIFCLGLRGVA